MLAGANSSSQPEFTILDNVPLKHLLKKKVRELVDPLKCQGMVILKPPVKGIKLGTSRKRVQL